MPNGCFKTTSAHRLDDVNRSAATFIGAFKEQPIQILDVATSSGISTQEWHDDLAAAGIDARVIGTDLIVDSFHFPGSVIDILADRHFQAIHLGLFGSGMHPRILKGFRAIGLNAYVRLLRRTGREPIRLPLVSKGVKSISLVELDIEEGIQKLDLRFHVIRAANILNNAYFSPDRLRVMARGLVEKLHQGGLLIVSRTQVDGSNDATIFRFDGCGVQVIERLGRGSEIEAVLV